jgi:AraC-like DNA-binding protein
VVARSPQLAVRALRPVVAGLEALGHSPAELLAGAGIAPSLLEEPDGRVPHGAMMALWLSATESTGDESLGFHVALAAPIESFEMHAYAVLSSPDLRAAYSRACRYQRLIHETTELSLTELDGEGVLRHQLPGGRSVPRQPAEFLVTSWLRFGRLVTGSEWQPSRVSFDHPAPAEPTDLQRFFGAGLQFRSGRTAMHIPEPALNAPNPKADPALLALLDRHAALLLADRPLRSTVSRQVLTWLTESLGSERPTAERASAALHRSPRTLRRQLRDEGTSFRELVEGFRHERAVFLLSSARYAIADVAFLLGYSELSAFYRAFRRWTGATPAEYRADRTVGGSA